jgi:argininosuccinate lyase
VLPKLLKFKINKAAMKRACEANFSTATDLADLIVKEKDIPFRKAHEIVGRVVSKAIKAGIGVKEIDSKFIDGVAVEILKKPLKIEDEKVRKALDPSEAVKAKKVVGGPAPKEVKRMLGERKKRLLEAEKRLNGRTKNIQDSKKALIAVMDEIMEG